MRLYVPAGTAEDIGYFSSGSREVVCINFKFIIGSIGSYVTHGARLKVSLLRTLSNNNII